MSQLITMSSRQSGKAIALKDGWITQIQEQQREMREDGSCDSYEKLADRYIRELCKVKDSVKATQARLSKKVALD